MEQLSIKMSFGARFLRTLVRLKASMKSRVNWLVAIWLLRPVSVFLVKLLLEIISLNSGLVLNCQQLLYPIRVVMIRQVLWTTWQFQEPIQMSRIDGLHGKQVQIMIGHPSCLVIQEIWLNALSTIYPLISTQTELSDFQKNMSSNTMSVKKFQIFQTMSIMLKEIPSIHLTMLPTGRL